MVMEKSNKKVLILSLLLTVVFIGVLYTYIKRSTETTTPAEQAALLESGDRVKTYVAAKDIPEKSKITEEDIKEVFMDANGLREVSFQSKEEITGKYTQQTLYENEPFITKKVASTFEESVQLEIPTGKRAVTLPINELSVVAFHPKIGDRVDVVAIFNKEQMENIPAFEKNVQIAVQNVKVLSYGVVTEEVKKPKKETTKSITLLVDPDEAENLIFASVFGDIRFILRGEEDDGRVETPGARRDYFKR
jgi:pilus assembly protein CpaB